MNKLAVKRVVILTPGSNTHTSIIACSERDHAIKRYASNNSSCIVQFDFVQMEDFKTSYLDDCDLCIALLPPSSLMEFQDLKTKLFPKFPLSKIIRNIRLYGTAKIESEIDKIVETVFLHKPSKELSIKKENRRKVETPYHLYGATFILVSLCVIGVKLIQDRKV